MTKLVEGNLTLDATEAQHAFKLDLPDEKLTHFDLAAVDFVIVLESHVVLLELKDPDDPSAKYHEDRNNFIDRFRKKKHNQKLLRKFRDSFFVLYAYCLNTKPVFCVAVIASEDIGKPERESVAEDIANRTPISALAPEGWKCCPFDKVWVLDFDEWNHWFKKLPLFRNT